MTEEQKDKITKLLHKYYDGIVMTEDEKEELLYLMVLDNERSLGSITSSVVFRIRERLFNDYVKKNVSRRQ